MIPSPLSVSQYLQRSEERFESAVDRICQSHKIFFFLVAAVCVSLLYKSIGGFFFPGVIVAYSIYFLKVATSPTEKASAFLLLGGAAAIFISKVITQVNIPLISIPLNLIFIITPTIFLFISRNLQTNIRIIGFGTIALLECFISARLEKSPTGFFQQILPISPLSQMMTLLYLMYEDKVKKFSMTDPNFWGRLFNPTSFILVTFKEKDFQLSPLISPMYTMCLVRGTKNFILAFIFTKASALLNGSLAGSSIFLKVGVAYPLFYFNAASITLYLWAALQLMGVFVKDPYQYPFLAANPVERWSRWNIYTSEWYKTVVFFPVLKKTQSNFLAVLAITLCSIVIHMNYLDIGQLLNGNWQVFKSSSFQKIFVPFSLQGLSIYLFFIFPRIFGESKDSSGWRGLFITWLIMAGIYYTRLFF